MGLYGDLQDAEQQRMREFEDIFSNNDSDTFPEEAVYEDYTDYLVQISGGMVDPDTAKLFQRILQFETKEQAVAGLDVLAEMLAEEDPISAISTVSFLSGTLCANSILTQEESEAYSRAFAMKMADRGMGAGNGKTE